MSEIIVAHEVPEGKNRGPLFIAPTAIFSRIEAAAEWCQQTEYEFIKAAISDRLDEVEPLMEGWDEEEGL